MFGINFKNKFDDLIKDKVLDKSDIIQANDYEKNTKINDKNVATFIINDINRFKIKTSTNSENNLRKRFENLKKHLFLFLDYDNVPPTNNSSEQALRPSVIFRKVTNGFRIQIGKDIFANFITVIDTAKKQGKIYSLLFVKYFKITIFQNGNIVEQLLYNQL